MSAFRNYDFTEQVCHPDSPGPSAIAWPSQFPGSLEDESNTHPAPPSPLLKRRDPASNPDLPSPSKRMRLLAAGISTTSASCLVTKGKVTFDQIKQIIAPPVLEHVPKSIPEPDWSLLQDKEPLSSYSRGDLEARCRMLTASLSNAQTVISCHKLITEGQNAQLIIQNIGMEKMSLTLHEKEKPKQTERAALFPDGKGRHLTHPEFIAQKRKAEDDKKREEEEKKQRKEAKASKKALKAKVEERWKAACIEHDQALVHWKTECDRLRAAGTAVKNLPKKPKRVLKKTIEEEMGVDDESDDESVNGGE
ncbi:hypothetical protein CPB83DRAFT_925196 [Crepidotus variabilis]|uniref:Uncharacterized protein n=1 Tax=Crepidotus variabilis TaxID=179855 RepID=A0A9P6EJB1_9AGAR|nr:hypothetical protein CPB83DRAFT_773054 [Crepidotus variabilis]KAF9529887.1 hypothetical protein CPB83DRAFT_925196 [Crepidotus variabilis]